jgi:tripartite-type tricarboxylate transporter receptor subunit TctC
MSTKSAARLGQTALVTALFGLPVLTSPLAAQDGAEFFKGKTGYIVIGSATGGGFDTYGRLVARHLTRFVPGAPVFIPQNMPGSGGNDAAHRVAQAPPDGLTIGAIRPTTILSPLLGKTAALRESVKFQYLGNLNSDVEVCVVRSGAAAKTFAEVLKTEIVLGGATEGSTSREFPTISANVLGAKFKVVPGYTGNREIFLAMSRGEVDGACGVSWSGFKATQADSLKRGEVSILVQEDIEGHPELNKQGIPKTADFAKTQADKDLLEIFYSQQLFGRPYVVGSAVPADRLTVLRKAFEAMMNDKEFLADAEKIQLEIDQMTGEQVQKIIDKVLASPPETVERLRKVLGYGS